MRSLSKLLRPHPSAKSRIHDLQGHVAPLSRVALNFPRAIWSRVLLNTLKKFPERPWISYDATALLQSFMEEAPRSVLEFGSGNSTLWFAKRAAVLHSVEHNPEWYRRVQELLSANKTRATVVYELWETQERYSTFRADSTELWDIILIDGIWRLPVAQNHIDRLAPNGILYLDNSDADSSSEVEKEIPELLRFCDDWARRTNRIVEIFTDFSPTALHATQGRFYTSRLNQKS